MYQCLPPLRKEICPRCGGYGEVEKHPTIVADEQIKDPKGWTYNKVCSHCKGEGLVYAL